MLLRKLAVAARRFCSRALAAKVHASAGAVAHMAHGATGSIEKPALLAGNERVLAAFAVQALRALARAARGLCGGLRQPTHPSKAESRLTGRLIPVAVQRLPVVADPREHGAAGGVENEGPHGHGIPGLGPARGADVEPVGYTSSDGAVTGTLVAVHDVLGVVGDGLVAQVAAPVSVAGRLARDADQAVPLPAVERQNRRQGSCQLGRHGSAGARKGNGDAGEHSGLRKYAARRLDDLMV
jgi:hypothetical protein